MDSEIKNRITTIVFQTLKDNRILESSTFDLLQCETMDSVNRVAILVAIEEEYDFIFKLKEISAWNNVEQLVNIVNNHI